MTQAAPALGRATIVYLRFWKPSKTALRLARAVVIARVLADLVATGTVCRDERTGVRRPATPAMWAEGIEQMAAQRDRLVLPLSSHGYLRGVVFGLADKADATDEAKREQDARDGHGTGRAQPSPQQIRVNESPLDNEIGYLRNLVRLEKMSPSEAERRIADLIARKGKPA